MRLLRHGLRNGLSMACVALVLLLAGPAPAEEPSKELPWKYDLKKGLDEARKSTKRVFIDFSGVDCIPCRANEKQVFPLPEVRQRLSRFELVQLYTDRIPNAMYPPEVRKTFGEDTEKQEADARPNRELMAKLKGKAAPLYVVVEPAGDSYKEIARYDKGLIISKEANDVAGFVAFLDKGLEMSRASLPAPVEGPKTSRGQAPATADRIDFDVKVEPSSARRGDVIRLVITGRPREGFHTYPLTMRSSQQNVAQLSKLNIPGNKSFQPLGPVHESDAEFVREETGEVLLEHKKPFTWTQAILISPDASPGKADLAFSVKVQVCDDHGCTWGTHSFTVPVTIKTDPPVPAPGSLTSRSAEKKTEIIVKEVPESFKSTPSGQENGTGLLAFILQGVFWGAVSLVTPCVFPMIPITVSFFLKQSEKEHHRPLLTALVYSGTIVVVLTIAAVALLSVFREMSTYSLMNFALGGLFVFFALSLFGMYEIELPSGLARFTSSREGQGVVGTIFMALTFTIISFACVAPFLGGFGGTAATANLGPTKMLLGGLAFAVTFASPFTVLALFPALLKKMPKSGTWLNSVKVVMGFLELAAALKFFRQGELLVTDETQFFTYDFVLSLYIGICLLCGLYLLCLYRLPHDTPVEHLGVPRLLIALAFLGLGFYLMPAMWKATDKGLTQRPKGVVFAWLDAFLLPEHVKDLPWIGDLQEGLKMAAKSRKRVFIDFTGKTCTNCKINEREVFPKPEVRELLLKYILVSQYTDLVPDDLYPDKVRATFHGSTTRQKEDAKKNLQFQKDTFDTEQLPLYAIVEPDGKDGFRVVDKYTEGKINNVSAFADFLRRNLVASEE
ncbi:MAG: thioredoxin family protein [Planctomycetes bacterium]|nr:thioredoxin family protein [Planctomycetota bacterium]